MNPKKKALGRGLSAILESPETDITSSDISGNFVAGAIASLPLSQIEANPFQPREDFDQEALSELAASIKEQGIIQPITVRKMGYDKYQLISGERRLKASRLAGLDEIPCYIRIANDQQMLEMALVENIQRESLNALEIAISYQRLIEECELTQEELSQRVGKNRTTVTNYIRLLKLPAELQVAIRDNKISMGHARALINIDDEQTQVAILKNIITKDLSVREVEEIVRNLNKQPASRKEAPARELPREIEAIRENIAGKLDTKVNVSLNQKGKGNIVISFNSQKQLERILAELLSR
ncbi:ParB/RepB/Spo0J family partition protein [Lentimicrobium sp.]|uniref:ParB/RepB/Spo0J family partition protein n=1 Tax=Lentimicrobium sp. TaxID=2034841 RepID=UPI0025DEE356|nr:ParB/RepB/Spo0J family partition protein [Lentimicrobium sp.]MCO5256680.1 ParB/RepB/Spo0J family partition protein [Lentimicrobium sp.]HPF64380.1 ParB/RepB/Spo0J family partition protein [Lentimicrobium sp.]HPJ62233.1 ParB/RepB/Spo0J family partition protein [Lentimicrobium sp.]HPR25606.1 ParB/RepB/Spo0J family partition protein [Lentimicrobium sp.]